MNTLLKIFTPLFLLAVLHVAQAAEMSAIVDLPDEVEDTLEANASSAANLGIWVQAVGDEQPLLAWNAERTFNPASVMKLVTTAAALDILGANYTWPTEVYATTPVREGVL